MTDPVTIVQGPSRTPMSRVVQSRQQLRGIESHHLLTLLDGHDDEIRRLDSRLDSDEGPQDWRERAVHAKRVLFMHRAWIEEELKRREPPPLSEAERVELLITERKRMLLDAKAANVAASTTRNLRIHEAFKRLVSARLGQDEYMQLIEAASKEADA